MTAVASNLFPGEAHAAGAVVAPCPGQSRHGRPRSLRDRVPVPLDAPDEFLAPPDEFVMPPDEFVMPPDDLCDPEDPHPPRYVSEEDRYDDLQPMSRIDALEWELWAGVEQDEAEREMLRLKAPAWVFLPPGAELAAALEELRPQCESPVALIEAMKAAARLEAWAASIRTAAMASFVRQRKAQLAEIPRPTQLGACGRPVDPERSWAAEIGAALHLSPQTAARHIDTALHLTGPLAATHTALRCGALSFSKALAISEATRDLPAEAARAVEAHVLRRAPGQTHKNLGESLRRQVAKHTTKDDANRHRAAVTDRTCKIVPLPDGMAGLWVVHTADKIQQMWVVIQAMADLAKRGTPTSATSAATGPASTASPSNTTGTAGPGGTGGPTSAASSTATRTNTTGTARTATSTGGPINMDSRTASGTPRSANGETAAGTAGKHTKAPTDTAADAAVGMAVDMADGTAAGEAGGVPSPHRPDPDRPAPDRREHDERTAEQRRADAVADLFGQMLHNGLDWLGRRLPDQHRRRPHIEVLIPITTLLGIDDDPCELTGYGPIPADMARRIATDSTWRRLLTDPTNGTVLEASTTRHDPGAIVTETLLARHPVCAWPGCNRTSRECDRDHATPFAQTGQTSLTGLVPYCEYHHVIKDTRAWGWASTAHPDGSVTLTSPTGHRYTTVPPARGPITPERATNHRPPRPPNDPAPF